MKAWVKKETFLKHTKSGMLKSWALNNFNSGVPGTTSLQAILNDNGVNLCRVTFRPWFHGCKVKVDFPLDQISVDHPLFKHSVRLDKLVQILAILSEK